MTEQQAIEFLLSEGWTQADIDRLAPSISGGVVRWAEVEQEPDFDSVEEEFNASL